jgi:heavy metal sensor kinase
MSLRLRLTLLYTSLAGGILLIFGALTYGIVSRALITQIDVDLARAANALIERIYVNAANQVDARSLAGFQTTENLLFQIWGNERQLMLARPATLQTPLDEVGLLLGGTVFETATSSGRHLRVVSVRINSERGPVGVLQVGINLVLVDITQRTLALALVILLLLAMGITGLAAWVVTGKALAPLAMVTRVATQITKADDLSRRIPLAGSPQDEVGQLIRAFNETLERLEDLFTRQRRFLADVSHELRTPLTVIKGNVGLVRKLGEADEESLNGIEQEVDRLTRMVGDLLLLAQAESGRLPLALGPVELDTVLLEVFQQMRVLAGEKIQIRVTEIDQVLVTGDRDRLKQVLVNLVGNAVQYTPGGGTVSLALRKTDQQVQIIINDTGQGIPAADLPHIFERFYRGEKSRKRSSASSGFGLGLSIAFWIVKAHGGTIEVTSKEGQGTTFCVWLPLSGPPQKAEEKK